MIDRGQFSGQVDRSQLDRSQPDCGQREQQNENEPGAKVEDRKKKM